MPRRPNTKPTHIYWLIDMRPEIIAAGWGNGQPFYCGKTVRPKGRLQEHKSLAERGGTRPVLVRTRECGDHVRMQIMETVPPEKDWTERERHWIAMIRCAFPAVNVAEGGTGVPGLIFSDEHRRKLGEVMRKRCADPDFIKKLSAAHKGQKQKPEQREKSTAHLRSLALDPKMRAIKSETAKRMWRDPQYRARMTAMSTGRKLSAEACEKIAASKRGKPLSAAHKAKVGAVHRGKTISAEHRAILSATHQGKPKSSEQRAKMSIAAKAWRAARRAEKSAAKHD